MGEPHVISALVAKRAELAGQILALDRKRAVLIDQLSSIDHTLAIFTYEGNPRDIKPKGKHVYIFKRNELPRLLRKDGGQGTNREIALRIIEAKGWNAANKALIAKVIQAIKSQKNWRNRRLSINSAQ
jgi:hypothetical protein